MEEQKMREHIKLLGIFYIVFGGMSIARAVIVKGILSGVGSIVENSILPVLQFTNSIVFIISAIVGVPLILGGISLIKYKSWARIFVLILGIINILGFPIGTILGIYTIWVLSKEESKKVLIN